MFSLNHNAFGSLSPVTGGFHLSVSRPIVRCACAAARGSSPTHMRLALEPQVGWDGRTSGTSSKSWALPINKGHILVRNQEAI